MGLFKSIKGLKDVVSSSNGVGENALIGRALVIDASLSGMAINVGVEEYRVCNMRLQVFVDGQAAYIAECRQKVQEWRLGQLVGQAFAVRVDATDPQKVALDFSIEAPVVTLARPADGGAQALLATGRPAEAVIVSNAPLGLRSWDGNDVHMFVLTVVVPGQDPYQAQLGNPIPAAALPYVFPGSRVPVKLGANPHDVAIDWAAAAAALTAR
jgi:hypothetical protein